MDRQPTLPGELLRMRPLGAEDFGELFAVASDPLIWEQHPDSDRYTEKIFTIFFHEALASGGALVAIDAQTNKVIGSSRYHGFDPAAREVEIGWSFLARSHWGGRYNWEMKRLMLDHAFRFVDTVVFLVGPHNTRSQKALGKIGALPAGRRIGSNGREALAFTIDKAAWGKRRVSSSQDRSRLS